MVNIYMHYYYFWASAYFSYGRQTPINQSINQSITILNYPHNSGTFKEHV